jgi:hypothetical protein
MASPQDAKRLIADSLEKFCRVCAPFTHGYSEPNADVVRNRLVGNARLCEARRFGSVLLSLRERTATSGKSLDAEMGDSLRPRAGLAASTVYSSRSARGRLPPEIRLTPRRVAVSVLARSERSTLPNWRASQSLDPSDTRFAYGRHSNAPGARYVGA